MKIVIAGTIFLMSGVLGIISYTVIFGLNKEIELNSEKRSVDPDSFFATMFSNFLKKISWKQMGMIIAAALFSAVAAYRLWNSNVVLLDFWTFMLVALLLIPVMIIDWYEHRIPNKLVLAMIGVGIIMSAFEFNLCRESVISTLLIRFLGLICCMVLFYVMSRLTRDGMGMGDVKLIAALGWTLGFSTTMTVILFALIFCTIFAVILILEKKKHKSDHLPFGPFVFWGYIFLLMLLSI